MKLVLRHINALLLAVLAVVMTACGGGNVVPEEPDDSDDLFLVCNIGMVGETRANPVPQNESMRSLRIIILGADGAVESNEYIRFDSYRESYSHISEVKREARKRIYFVANEESVASISSDNNSYPLSGSLHAFLESVTAGDKDFEKKINAVHYEPDFMNDITLTSMYDVDIPEGIRFVEKDFWLVRVATKFSFIFENHRLYDDVQVDYFEISTVADRHFLMPRFTNGNAPSFPGYPTWIDWLRDISDLSQIDPNNPTSDVSGWLTTYEIPGAAHQNVLRLPMTFGLPKYANGSPGTYRIDNVYAPESKRLRESGNMIRFEQQYFLRVVCNNGAKTFDIALPNLRALFRNTHVVVEVTFTDGDFQIVPKIDVIPFSEVIVKPEFGLERDDVSGYVVVRDPNTGEIKYWLDAKGDKWWLYQDGESHFVFAYEEPTLDNLDHWFDFKGNRHELTPKGISGLDPHYNTTTGALEFYEDKTGHKYWLVEGPWFTIDKYNFVENGSNPSGASLGWYDFTGDFHEPTESKDAVLEKWKKILGGLDPSN